MIGRLWTFINKVETDLRVHWLARAVLYALIAAAVYLTWLFTGGESVAFIYNEF